MEAVRPAERDLHRPQRQIYVADSQSNAKLNPGFKRGIRIGSAKDGRCKPSSRAWDRSRTRVRGEGVAADAMGNVTGRKLVPPI